MPSLIRCGTPWLPLFRRLFPSAFLPETAMKYRPDAAEITCAIFLAAGVMMWSTARAAAWQLADSSSRAQVEVDLASVTRKEGTATGWVQHTYARQTSSQSGAYFAYRSRKEHVRISCNERSLAVLARAYFNDESNEIAMIKGKGESRPVTPDSLDQGVLTRMCNPPPRVAAVPAVALPAVAVPVSTARYMDTPVRIAAAHGFVRASVEAGAPARVVPVAALQTATDKAHAPESRQETVSRVQKQRSLTPREAIAAASAGHGGAAAHSHAPGAAAPGAAQSEPHSGSHDVHWRYDGANAPYRWGDMKSDFALCKSGTRQSPIDIRNPVVSDTDPIRFHYEDAPLKVTNNGHTIQVDVAPGSFILHGGQRYELMQFHFHTPSEERVNGRAFDMVAHLVHKSAQGRVAVVAVLLTAGKEQAMLQHVWNAMPGSAHRSRERLDLMINAAQLLPADPAYYSFMGSLTTPPCTEGVQWLVMKTPVEISREQISHFAALYPMNARPLQASNDRLIKAGK